MNGSWTLKAAAKVLIRSYSCTCEKITARILRVDVNVWLLGWCTQTPTKSPARNLALMKATMKMKEGSLEMAQHLFVAGPNILDDALGTFSAGPLGL